MENINQGLEEKVESIQSLCGCYGERITKLEESMNDVVSKITSLNAAVERALSSLLPKVESLITNEQVASEASADEAAPGTGEAAAPSTSTSQASSISNPRGTSVMEAAAAGDAVALSRMFENPNARDSNGVPALYLAASRGHVEAVGALLEGGAQVDSDGYGLRTALHEAIDKGHLSVVRRLLKAGSKLEVKDAQGNNPLMLAVKGRHWHIARLLVEKGADSNAAVFEGKSALIVAAEEGDCETVKLMLRHKKPDDVCKALSYAKNASVVWAFEDALSGIIRKEGGGAMGMAAECDRLESMVALLKAGVGIESKGKDGWTALMWASWYGHVECVKELVRRGALLEDNVRGSTALHLASCNGKEEAVRVLLDAGANPTKENNDRKTALDYAKTEAVRDIFRKHNQLKSSLHSYSY